MARIEEAASGANVDARLMLLSGALLVEREARARNTVDELSQYLVNETARVHEHQLGFLLRPRGTGWRIAAASDVSAMDASSAIGRWLVQLARRRSRERDVSRLDPDDRPLTGDQGRNFPNQCLWIPLPHPRGGLAGVLALFRDRSWSDADLLIAEPLAECYGHAIGALEDRSFWRRRRAPWGRIMALLLVIGLIGAGAWEVPLTTLAPARVVSSHMTAIASPIDGVVEEVRIKPYQSVRSGDVLVVLDPDRLELERNIARQSLAVTKAELEQFRRGAFLDPGNKTKAEVWKKKVTLAELSLARAEARLAEHRIIASSDGIALFDDEYEWRGLPVKSGQRLVVLADPARLEIEIELPVANLIPLEAGGRAVVFLDMDPSRQIEAIRL